jgi:hypothetical protein
MDRFFPGIKMKESECHPETMYSWECPYCIDVNIADNPVEGEVKCEHCGKPLM